MSELNRIFFSSAFGGGENGARRGKEFAPADARLSHLGEAGLRERLGRSEFEALKRLSEAGVIDADAFFSDPAVAAALFGGRGGAGGGGAGATAAADDDWYDSEGLADALIFNNLVCGDAITTSGSESEGGKRKSCVEFAREGLGFTEDELLYGKRMAGAVDMFYRSLDELDDEHLLCG